MFSADWTVLQANLRHVPMDRSPICAVHADNYSFRGESDPCSLSLKYVTVQLLSGAVGACYHSELIDASEVDAMLGRSWPACSLHRPLQIATLDAAMQPFVAACATDVMQLRGPPSELASARADIVVDYVKAMRDVRTVTCVGVVPPIVTRLLDAGFEVDGTDFREDREVLDLGIRLGSGDDTAARVRESDVAVVTGMTLANDTCYDIIRSARESHTRVVVFAQTASSIWPLAVGRGVHTVLAEPFPFYLSGTGHCQIRCHTSRICVPSE